MSLWLPIGSQAMRTKPHSEQRAVLGKLGLYSWLGLLSAAAGLTSVPDVDLVRQPDPAQG
jgi:hypothetical protein